MSKPVNKADLFRHELILLSIRGQGKCFADIARKLRVSPALVTMVSKGQRSNGKVREALAEACLRPVSVLFPGHSGSGEKE